MLLTRRLDVRLALAVACSALFCAPARPQPPGSAPTTQIGTADSRRFDDLMALIEGPNLPLAARVTGARELLRLDWPQRTSRLCAVLSGTSPPARIAVALALADVPEARDPAYVAPLMGMLLADDREVSRAAATALASYRDGGVVASLRSILLNEGQPLAGRLAALEALGMMSQREAVCVLAQALGDPNSPVCQPALRAFERATATSFGDDLAAARAWWERNQTLALTDWQQEQIERLVQKARELERRLRGVEGRLVEAFRQEYIRAAESDRAVLLQNYLKDECALVRLLGLELVNRHLGEGKELPAEAADPVREQARALLQDGEPAVRAAAAQVVARFRETTDADRFLNLLSTERHVDTRRALVSGLGYIGNGQVVSRLLEILQDEADCARAEAAAALGRLGERGVLSAPARAAVAEALRRTFERTLPAQSGLRERVLWAVGVLGEPNCGEILVAALSQVEVPAVRQTAVRGLAALKDPQWLDALVPLAGDSDPAVRRTALEALADLATTDRQLEALWVRLDPNQEPDAGLRRAAWRGVVRMLRERGLPAVELERWIERLPGNGGQRAEQLVELLEILEETLARTPGASAELGRARARLAAQYALLGQTDAAVSTYLLALRDLHVASADEAQGVARELFFLALRSGRYDPAVAGVLASANPPLDGSALWEELSREVEQLLAAGEAGRAVLMLEVVRTNPPTAFTPDTIAAMDRLLARARAAQAFSGPTPSSQPDVP